MAIYKQNSQSNIGTTDQVTKILLDDVNNFGDTDMSLYKQDEAIIMKILLATYHMDNPDITVGAYLESVFQKHTPSIIAVTRAIYRSISDNLPSYKEKRKLALEIVQQVRPEKDKIEYIVDKYSLDLNRTSLIVQYYIDYHGITKNTRIVDWLDIAAKPEIPSLGFIDISIMRKEDKDKKDSEEFQ